MIELRAFVMWTAISHPHYLFDVWKWIITVVLLSATQIWRTGPHDLWKSSQFLSRVKIRTSLSWLTGYKSQETDVSAEVYFLEKTTGKEHKDLRSRVKGTWQITQVELCWSFNDVLAKKAISYSASQITMFIQVSWLCFTGPFSFESSHL